MFNLFKDRPRDVKEIRNALLHFIKEKLRNVEGGEGGNIMGVYLFINCGDAERHLYESAVFASSPGKFRSEEIQKIADDYAIALSPSWKFEVSFTDEFPAQSYLAKNINAALVISTRKHLLSTKGKKACIKVLNGEAEKKSYFIDSSSGRINIGREAQVKAAGNFVRKNTIAFSTGELNRSISRQHAHIEWEAESGSFIIFADEGGIPPNNKTKIRSAEGVSTRMQATEVGHRLEDGDQVILGDAAVLEFTYSGGQE